MVDTGSNPVLFTKRGNKMQIKFTTCKGELIFVKPDGNLFSFKLFKDMGDNLLEVKTEIVDNNTIVQKWTNIRIDERFYLVGLASNVIEEIAKDFVDELILSRFENYKDKNCSTNKFGIALSSFKSILQHLGIDFDPIVLFKPNNN